MRIIPAIDIMDGKCVRLEQGDFRRTTCYSTDPVAVAKSFEDAGLEYLHLVDLDGARSGRVVNWRVIEAIAGQTSLKVDVGGGIHDTGSVQAVFESGAYQVTGGTVAVRDPELFLSWLATYGSDRVILGADVRDEQIAVAGWKTRTRHPYLDFIRNYASKGVEYVTCTEISHDGMLTGPAFHLYRHVLQNIPEIRLVASGGIATVSQLDSLRELGLDGAIVGKALYEEKITLDQLTKRC